MPRSSKIFRLFVSSTFTDLKAERTILHTHVYPRLQVLCESHGAKFQAIDLRWGVNEEASMDHKTLDICLHELRRCQELSPRPNFLILLGNRYGWRPIPSEIEKEEFEQIIASFTPESEEAATLKEWYCEDTNAQPVHYCLQPRRGHYMDANHWNAVEQKLRQSLHQAIVKLHFSEMKSAKYRLSATEHEIREGAFQQDNADDHVFAFFRELQQLPQDVRAKDYIDLDSSGQVDGASVALLNRLKTDLERFLPDANISRYIVPWSEVSLDTAYLQEFAQDVLDRLTPIIERELDDLIQTNLADKETELHDKFAEERARHFVGRKDLFHAAKQHLKIKNSPLLILGESGSGKSALAAKLSLELKHSFAHSKVVHRYIGASAYGLSSVELLTSLLAELAPEELNDSTSYIDNVNKLMALLEGCFKKATPEQPLMIVIDALDQLSDVVRVPKWFPVKLPVNVHLIVTCALDSELAPHLKELLEEDSTLHIHPLREDEGREILRLWLNNVGRTLQPSQTETVLQGLAACPLPIYLRLAFEEARLWKSYTENVRVGGSIEEMIEQFFERLSSQSSHEKNLIHAVFGMFASARNGLAEAELLELLERDQTVMEQFRLSSKHVYIYNQLPVVLWARMLNDLEPYLVEKQQNGVFLYSFYHRQIAMMVKQTYWREQYVRQLADYFADMPHFSDLGQSQIPHYRKVSELPYLLLQSGQTHRLEQLLIDFDFVQAKLQARLSQDLLQDYILTLGMQEAQGTRSSAVEDFLRFCRIRHSLLSRYPSSIRMLALQMPKTSQVFLTAKQWFEEHELPYLTYENGRSNAEIERCLHAFDSEDNHISVCCWHPNGYVLLTVSGDKIKLWDTLTGKEIRMLQPQVGDIRAIAFSADGQMLGVVCDKSIKVYSVGQYELRSAYTSAETKFTSLSWRHEGHVIAAGSYDGSVRLIDCDDKTQRIVRGEFSPVHCCAWNPAGNEIAVWHANDHIAICDVEDLRIRITMMSGLLLFDGSASLTHHSISWSLDGRFVYATTDRIVTMWDSLTGVRFNSTSRLGLALHIMIGDAIVSIQNTNSSIQIWDSFSGSILLNIWQSQFKLPKHASVLANKLCVISDEGKISIWDIRVSGQPPEMPKVQLINDQSLWVLDPIIQPFITLITKLITGSLFRSTTAGQLGKRIGHDDFNLFEDWNGAVTAASASPGGSYLASGHLEGFIQLKHLKTGEVRRYKPFKTGAIHLCVMDVRERLLFYATDSQAWIMNTHNGFMKKVLKTKQRFAGGYWSPCAQRLIVVYSDGMLELYDFETDSIHTTHLMVEGGMDRLGDPIGGWSADGKSFASACGNQIILFDMNKPFTVRMTGEASNELCKLSWSPKGDQIAFMDDHYEIIIMDLMNKSMNVRLQAVSIRELEEEPDYFNKLKLSARQKKQHLELQLQKKEDPTGKTEQLSALTEALSIEPFIRWSDDQHLLIVTLGNRVKIYSFAHLEAPFILYHDQSITEWIWHGSTQGVALLSPGSDRFERLSLFHS